MVVVRLVYMEEKHLEQLLTTYRVPHEKWKAKQAFSSEDGWSLLGAEYFSDGNAGAEPGVHTVYTGRHSRASPSVRPGARLIEGLPSENVVGTYAENEDVSLYAPGNHTFRTATGITEVSVERLRDPRTSTRNLSRLVENTMVGDSYIEDAKQRLNEEARTTLEKLQDTYGYDAPQGYVMGPLHEVVEGKMSRNRVGEVEGASVVECAPVVWLRR